MDKSKKNWIMLGIAVLAVFFIIRIAVEAIDERKDIFIHIDSTNRTICNSRSDVCTEQYTPVCGWYNPNKIQCIKYPCAQTYSNSCFACGDDKVGYYTQGECPKN